MKNEGVGSVPPRNASSWEEDDNQPTMSQRISRIRRLYDDPRLSIRWATYSGCNLWYFRLGD